MILKEQIGAGNFTDVNEMERLWLEKGGRNVSRPQVEEVDEEAGSSADEEDDEDMEMGEAAAPRERAPRPEPVIDEDGFETVQPRRRR